jgi:hypothetical protein
VLPPLRDLQELLETAFFASLEREEGRMLRFSVCFSETFQVPREDNQGGVKIIPILPSRRFTVETLRALAPAVRPDSTAMVVRPGGEGEEGLRVTAITHMGSEFARGRVGKTFVHTPPPYALIVEVRGPGELHVYQGKTKLAVLESGSIHTPVPVSALEFAPAADILEEGRQGFWSRINPPTHEPEEEWLNFQSMALLSGAAVAPGYSQEVADDRGGSGSVRPHQYSSPEPGRS